MSKNLKIKIAISAFICLILAISCGCTNQAEKKVTTKYIGDNSKVSQIVNTLPYPKDVSYASIEIQSSKKPYELKLFLKTNKTKSLDLKECAQEAFERIENMGIISFYNKDNNKLIESFNRK